MISQAGWKRLPPEAHLRGRPNERRCDQQVGAQRIDVHHRHAKGGFATQSEDEQRPQRQDQRCGPAGPAKSEHGTSLRSVQGDQPGYNHL